MRAEADLRKAKGEVYALRASVVRGRRDLSESVELSRRALDLLPQDDLALRAEVELNLGICYQELGDLPEAAAAFTKGRHTARQSHIGWLFTSATGLLGVLYFEQGRLREVVKILDEALEHEADEHSGASPALAIIHLSLSTHHHEWNELELAEAHAVRAVDLAEGSGISSRVAWALSALARVKLDQGDPGKALSAMERAEGFLPDIRMQHTGAVIRDDGIRLRLALGDLAGAVRRAGQLGPPPEDEQPRAMQLEHLTFARVLMAQGKNERAISLLDRLLAVAEDGGLWGRVIKILAFKAVALHADGQVGQAVQTVARALSLAEPEGWVRTFIEHGQPMEDLLRRAAFDGCSPSYARRLLAALAAECPQTGTYQSSQPLPEPLSDRELEVLALIAAGFSNRRIGDQLFVSLNTVKSHTKEIYRKLNVRSRTQASSKARELDLLTH